MSNPIIRRLKVLHAELDQCKACPQMIGPVVHGPPVASPVLLIGQAPGPHEGKFGKPFAWTAGKTLFRWFEGVLGIDEAQFRERIYMSAVARCFPGKGKSGGDRVPSPAEIDRCFGYVEREFKILDAQLIIPVGTLAIGQVLGEKKLLTEVIGEIKRPVFHGRTVDVIALPHPSGLSTWPRTEPGKGLLEKALRLIAEHPATKQALA